MLSKEFFLAGKAIFTISDPENHYTYQILKKIFPPRKLFYFLFHLIGPDNTKNFTYLGKLDIGTGQLLLTRRSRLQEDSGPVRFINETLPRIWRGIEFPEKFQVFHADKCGRCGLRLTKPESLVRGMGPICAGIMEDEWRDDRKLSIGTKKSIEKRKIEEEALEPTSV